MCNKHYYLLPIFVVIQSQWERSAMNTRGAERWMGKRSNNLDASWKEKPCETVWLLLQIYRTTVGSRPEHRAPIN